MFRRGLRRAALFCARSSDLKLQCLFATFLSTSLDYFEALGANFGTLGAILEPLGAHLGGSGGGLGGLGAPFGGSGAVLERSWAVLERSWRPSCGNVIFGCFLRRFWGRLGRTRRGQMEPKMEPKRTKIEDEKDDATRSPRPPQDDLEDLLVASSFSSSILVRFGSNLGSI